VVLGYALFPLAMMNHPYSIWLLPAGLALLPWFWREVGKLPVVLGLGAGLALAVPRLDWLSERLRQGDNLVDLSGRAGQGPTDGVLLSTLSEVSTIPLVFGAVVLGFLLVRGWRRGGDGGGRSAAIGLSVALALFSYPLIVASVAGYVQDYHLLQLYPWAALGWGAVVAGVFERLSARGSSLF
jgi:hypothetical protein